MVEVRGTARVGHGGEGIWIVEVMFVVVVEGIAVAVVVVSAVAVFVAQHLRGVVFEEIRSKEQTQQQVLADQKKERKREGRWK